MALNKFMHPRNIYRTPPNFVELAKSYEDFNKIAKMDVTGKITIDFKDPHSLRVLTKCLLKKDFDLDVTIPEDRLVPTLPLRLNYVLWVEDLMAAIGRKDEIRGLDIGTGACAVYPLLAAVKNKWRMVATESDEESLQRAKENVQRNQLGEFIDLRRSPSKCLLSHVFDEHSKGFDFSMCNPPFYSNLQELCESRSPARLPPKNAFTGSPQELITDGGELVFCRRMIEESKSLQDKIIIFTTMVGHKYNLKELEQDLRAEGINHTSTEFCQGRVTRWGLAWTYQHHDIAKLVPPRDKPRKPSIPMVFTLPQIAGMSHDVNNVSDKIKTILQILNINFKVVGKRGNHITIEIVASTNTWSSQRRKRRMLKRLEASDCKKPKINGSSNAETTSHVTDKILEHTKTSTKDEPNTFEENKSNEQKYQDNKTSEPTKNLDESNSEGNKSNEQTDKDENASQAPDLTNESKDVNNKGVSGVIKKTDDFDISQEHRNAQDENQSNSDPTNETCSATASTSAIEPVVHALMNIVKRNDEMYLEIECLGGSSGKEGLHQIVQYIKNNWK